MSIGREINRKYGAVAGSGYYFTGGDGNFMRQANTYLKKKNLPGQVITNALATQREQDPQYQTNLRLSRNMPVSQRQQNITADQGLQMVMGMAAPTKLPKQINIFSNGRPAGKAAKNVFSGVAKKLPNSKIDPHTQDEMVNFIDYVRQGQSQNLSTELGATRIAEKYGLKMPKRISGLANEFDSVLSKIRQSR